MWGRGWSSMLSESIACAGTSQGKVCLARTRRTRLKGMSERIPASAVEASKRRVISTLRSGQCVVMPTDTVYAVVADAFNRTALEAARRAKRRTRAQPLSVILRSPRQVTGLVSEISELADRLMAAYWPGPLTLVFHASDGLGWDLGDTLGTVGLRMPTDDLLLSIIAEVGPLACTGANMSGDRPVHDVDAAENMLGDAVALYVDGGVRDGTVSTIVDVTGSDPVVLREGAVPSAHVATVAAGELAWGDRPPAERDTAHGSPEKNEASDE